jgi:uncharacterized membrane protein
MTSQTTPTRNLRKTVLRYALAGAVLAAANYAALQGGYAIGGADRGDWHTPSFAIPLHLATVIPALPLGLWVLLREKGTATHKLLGRVWGVLMLVTALDSLLIRDLTGGLEPIHIFSVVTLVSIPLGIWHIRRGNIQGHRRAMIGPYIGLIVAGLFALSPGRLLGTMLFGQA